MTCGPCEFDEVENKKKGGKNKKNKKGGSEKRQSPAVEEFDYIHLSV